MDFVTGKNMHELAFLICVALQKTPLPTICEHAELHFNEVRLMMGAEFARLYQNATFWKEKFFGITKSLVAYGGFESER